MNRNQIVKQLMSEGFSSETLMKMSDKQINLLASRILSEQTASDGTINVKRGSPDEKALKQQGRSFVAYESEIKEDANQSNDDFIIIDVPIGSLDHKLFRKIAGLDSQMRPFTRSKFGVTSSNENQVASFKFHISEKPLLIERLEELLGGEYKDKRLYTVIENWLDYVDEYEEKQNELAEEDNDISADEPFEVHGHYTVSNSGGYEIMLSDDGDMARVRDAFGSDNPETSEWLPIEYVTDEEGEDEPVIDPEGYNIPLSQVMRANKYSDEEISNDDISEDYDDYVDPISSAKSNAKHNYEISGECIKDAIEYAGGKEAWDALSPDEQAEAINFASESFNSSMNIFSENKKQEVKTWLENIVENNYTTFTTKKEITEIINEKLKKHKKKAKLLLGQDTEDDKSKSESKKTKTECKK